MDQLVFDKKDTKKEPDCESSSEVGSRDMSIIKNNDFDDNRDRTQTLAPDVAQSQIYENQIKELIT